MEQRDKGWPLAAHPDGHPDSLSEIQKRHFVACNDVFGTSAASKNTSIMDVNASIYDCEESQDPTSVFDQEQENIQQIRQSLSEILQHMESISENTSVLSEDSDDSVEYPAARPLKQTTVIWNGQAPGEVSTAMKTTDSYLSVAQQMGVVSSIFSTRPKSAYDDVEEDFDGHQISSRSSFEHNTSAQRSYR